MKSITREECYRLIHITIFDSKRILPEVLITLDDQTQVDSKPAGATFTVPPIDKKPFCAWLSVINIKRLKMAFQRCIWMKDF